jgi:ribosomal protein L40E
VSKMLFQPLKRAKRLKTFEVLDIETRKKEFLMAGVFDGKNYKKFYSMEELVAFLVSCKAQTYYAHNLRYDGIYILNELIKKGIANKVKDAHGLMLELKILKCARERFDKKLGRKVLQNEYIVLRDSFALFPLSQEELASSKCFDVKVKKHLVDFSALEAMPVERAMPEYEARNNTDCVGLFQILEKAQEEVFSDFGVDICRCLTAAQLAMRAFRTNAMKHSIWNPLVFGSHRQLQVTPEAEFFKSAYAGGRVEVFDLNSHDKLECFDVNSMYPSCMLEKVPIGEFKSYESASESDLLALMEKYEGFAEVTVSTSSQHIPILWKKIDGKLFFANFDETKGVFPFPELRLALRQGIKFHEIHKVVVFPHAAPIFRQFVEKYYKMRAKAKADGNNGKAFLLKLILNSLYGKFAQKPDRDTLRIISAHEAATIKQYVEFNGEFYFTREKEFKPSIFYMPFVSAYITSYARVKLHGYLKKAINPVYCDTDSVHCSWLDEDSKSLGKMNHEKTLHAYRAMNPKVYDSVESRRAKGIPYPALHKKVCMVCHADVHYKDSECKCGSKLLERKVKSLEEFYKSPAEWEALCSYRKSITAKNNISYHDGLVKYTKMTRKFTASYSKREIMPDMSTKPFWISKGELVPGSMRVKFSPAQERVNLSSFS